jgi:hypothetical protein
VEWRITYFVESVEWIADGWWVRGEAGLGPPATGDEFSVVIHPDTATEDRVALRIQRYDVSSMVVVPSSEVDLRPGDILGGEVER